MLKLDYSKASWAVKDHEIANLKDAVSAAHKALHEGTCAGNDFLGWIDLQKNYDKE